MERLWKPDTHFLNGKNSYLHVVTTPNKLLRINKEGRILYSMRLDIFNFVRGCIWTWKCFGTLCMCCNFMLINNHVWYLHSLNMLRPWMSLGSLWHHLGRCDSHFGGLNTSSRPCRLILQSSYTLKNFKWTGMAFPFWVRINLICFLSEMHSFWLITYTKFYLRMENPSQQLQNGISISKWNIHIESVGKMTRINFSGVRHPWP